MNRLPAYHYHANVNGDVSYASAKHLVHQLVEEQVTRTPDVAAVMQGEDALTYEQLNKKANRLARLLRSRGVGPGELVALCVSRRLELVISVLAILKAGGAYIPIDPSHPLERLRHVLEDSEPVVVLTEEILRPMLPATSLPILVVDTMELELSSLGDSNLFPAESALTNDQLAYVIYTSGSTGRPKGTAMEHRSLVNLLEWHRGEFDESIGRRVLQFAALSFDVAFQEIFSTLSTGGTLVLLDEWTRRDPKALSELINAKSIGRLFLPPLMLQSLADYAASSHWIPNALCDVITAGEQLRITDAIRRLFAAIPRCRLHNHYGPTETHVVTALTLSERPHDWPDLPAIGRPIANAQIRILDEHGNSSLHGAVGEIYIGGISVARGYAGRPEMTARRFLPDPYTAKVGGRLYRTGDLGQWSEDVTLYYCGRNDDQIKIRGFRIELGEIETLLAQHRLIEKAVVVAREDTPGDKRLVAYVIPKGNDIAGSADKSDSSAAQMVGEWQAVYDSTYKADSEPTEPGFASWNSSYTGLPIPADQMLEWLRHTADRIRSLQPRRILEIGCGVGLLVRELAGSCEAYDALDFSAIAIRKLRAWLDSKPHMRHVRANQSDAADLSSVGESRVDTIIINSVAHHFPDVGYFLTVLETALQKITVPGRIFIGDVRNLDLLELFHTSVQIFKGHPADTVKQLRASVHRAVEEEKQLVLSPDFFRLLPHRFPSISSVDIQLKRGVYENELTKFRYDVVLNVDPARAGPLKVQDSDISVATIEQAWAETLMRPKVLRVCGVKNSRLSADLAAMSALKLSAEDRSLDLLELEMDADRQGQDPESIWSNGEQTGYSVNIDWTSGSGAGEFDVEFRLSSTERYTSEFPDEPVPSGIDWQQFANSPLRTRSREILGATLRESLRAHLPSHMIPSAFVILTEFPVTPTGKLYRQGLPAPAWSTQSSRAYEAPQGEIERELAGVWQDILCIERVGRNDNFFELGGQSLLIMRMLERLRRLGLSADLRSVFESQSLATMAAAIVGSSSDRYSMPPSKIPPGCDFIEPDMLTLVKLEPGDIARITLSVSDGAANIQDIYPVSPLQEGLLFHCLLSDGSGDSYVIPTLLSITSRATLDAFIAALQAVIDRHDVLRTAIIWEKLPQPVQVVHRQIRLPVEELSLDPDLDPVEQLRAHMTPLTQKLDLRKAPLIRVKIAADGTRARWLVLLQIHHLVVDHASLEILFSEVRSHLEGRDRSPPVPLQYRSHIARILDTARTLDPVDFFRSKLADMDEPTAPFGLLDLRAGRKMSEQIRWSLDSTSANRLRTQAKRLGVSVASVFHAAWALVVAQTTGRDDVVYGCVLLGRLQSATAAQPLLGLLVNTLPLRLTIRARTIRELIDHTQRELSELLQFEQASLAVAQRCSGLDAGVPLFTSLFNFIRSNPEAELQHSASIEGMTVLESHVWTNYPVTFMIDERDDQFVFISQTDLQIDPMRMIDYMREAVRTSIEALESESELPALSFLALPGSERKMVLDEFNDTQTAYPKDRAIHEVFEQHARLKPDSVAVLDDRQKLTYSELSVRSNRLAAHLGNLGVKVGDCIAIVLPRSVEAIVTKLAILKCGAVYVPIDSSLPKERQLFILRDCGARFAIHSPEAGIDVHDDRLQWVNCAAAADIGPDVLCAVNVHISADSPAYLMYTSGSTGAPKGVLVPHRAITRLVINSSYVSIGRGDCVAHSSNPSFDASTFEVWGALLNGARVLVVPAAVVVEPEAFVAFLRKGEATILWVTAGLLAQYVDTLSEVYPQLRYLITGGDVVDPSIFRRIQRNHPPQQLLNAYGPTECTTFSTTYLVESLTADSIRVPIGRPISNTSIYILNSYLQPAPIGVPGEIYIGGAGVALGYLHRRELTAERFVPDIFGASSSGRLYKTGDIGKWLPTGDIEFLGRCDRQLKIRGFRIEPGEIEAQLTRQPGVQEAVVVPQATPQGKRLIAYFTHSGGNGPKPEKLRKDLLTLLPEYMVPTRFVVLDSLPLTQNGKLDRGALPSPASDISVAEEQATVDSETERKLKKIWQKVLNVSSLRRDDNFFSIGGHSLLAIEMTESVNSEFDARLKVADIYNHPTLREIASLVATGPCQDDRVNLLQEAALDDSIVPLVHRPLRQPQAILLTGATGFVGRFQLWQILNDSRAVVFCPVRAKNDAEATARLRDVLHTWQLWRPEFQHRLVGIAADLGRPRLGLAESHYQHLCGSLDRIVHCAASMNHLESYASAKAANVDGARELLKLAIHDRPKVLDYVSTLSVFGPLANGDKRIVDELTPIDSEAHSISSGYTASKWVGEKMMLTASERGVPCNVFRLGLIGADSKQGRYDDLQRECRLLKSCLLMGFAIEKFDYSISPTPVDYAAKAIWSLALSRPDGGGIFHITSLSTVREFFEQCNEHLEQPLKLLPLPEWIRLVRRLRAEGDALPITPLVDFYEAAHLAGLAAVRSEDPHTQRELKRIGVAPPIQIGAFLRTYLFDLISRDERLAHISLRHGGFHAQYPERKLRSLGVDTN